jgi:hypothetical protein
MESAFHYLNHSTSDIEDKNKSRLVDEEGHGMQLHVSVNLHIYICPWNVKSHAGVCAIRFSLALVG